MSRWLVTGAGGMLGTDLVALLRSSGRTVVPASRELLDVTDAEACLETVRPGDVVVNAAAWTGVDDAETDEAAAFRVNAAGAANLARACARHGARLVQVSTDYVFDGTATSPYAEDAPMRPASAYGRTKAAGEWAVRAELPGGSWVVRTAWLYGEYGPSFVRTMLRLERERETVDVVADQTGQPTWTRDVAARVVELVDRDAPAGVYHATSSGETTWHGLAAAVFAGVGADPNRVRATTTAAFPRPAPRPAYSVLGHRAWAGVGLEPLRDWHDALRTALSRLATSSG